MNPERWQKLDKLLEEVMERSPEERTAFLAKACADDSELLREVQAILQAYEKGGSALDTPALQHAAKQLAAEEAAAPSLSLAGRTLGHYEVISLIGAGGMGEVYLAKDRTLGRDVAIKVLQPHLAQNKDALARFEREAKAIGALSHPNVCTILEFGESDGLHFIAMEYLEGQTLEHRIPSGPLANSEILDIAVQVADALDAAHGLGITHRDIKPSNIVILQRGQVKVLDFGVARVTKTPGQSSNVKLTESPATAAGVMVGTVQYMSPEQALGQPVDHRTDLFSFGVVLYQMTTGVLPFSGTSPTDTIDRILHAQPSAVGRFNYEVPEELVRIIRKCLEKNTERRYQSARDLLIDLRNLKRDIELASIQPPPQLSEPIQGSIESKNPYQKPLRRQLWLTGVATLSIFGVALFIWWLYLNYFRSPRAALAFGSSDWILITDVENLTGDFLFDKSLQTAITVGMQQSQYAYVFPQARVMETLQRMRKGNVDKIDESLASEIALREGIKVLLVSAIARVGSEYLLSTRLVDPNTRMSVMTQSIRASNKDKVLDGLDVLIKKVREGLGESLSSISAQSVALPKATTLSLDALKTFAEGQRILRTDPAAGLTLMEESVKLDPEFALAQTELGMRYYIGGQAEEGEKHFVEATKVLDRLTLRERLWINAVMEDWRGNRDSAIRSYEVYLSQYADDNTAWFRLGWTNMIMGNHEKAIDAFNKAIELNPSDASSYINLATTLNGQEKDEQALATYQKAFSLQPSFLTGNFVNNEYGFLLVKLGRISEAGETFQKMFAVTGSSDLDPDTRKALGHRSLALLNMYRGKYSEAAQQFKDAILLRKATRAALSEFRDHLFLATAYRAKGMRKEFESELLKAGQLEREMKLSGDFLDFYGKLFARSGKVKEAEQVLQKISSRLNDAVVMAGVSRSDRGTQSAMHLVRGEVALAKGKNQEAVEAFELASKVLEGPSILESMARGYIAQKKLDAAAEKYEEIIKQQSIGNENQEYWLNAHLELGKIFEQKGQPAKAREWYERLINIWREGDADLVDLNDAKAHLAKLGR